MNEEVVPEPKAKPLSPEQALAHKKGSSTTSRRIVEKTPGNPPPHRIAMASSQGAQAKIAEIFEESSIAFSRDKMPDARIAGIQALTIALIVISCVKGKSISSCEPVADYM